MKKLITNFKRVVKRTFGPEALDRRPAGSQYHV